MLSRGWERAWDGLLVPREEGGSAARSDGVPSPAEQQEGESTENPKATKIAEADGENPYRFQLGLPTSYLSIDIHRD